MAHGLCLFAFDFPALAYCLVPGRYSLHELKWPGDLLVPRKSKCFQTCLGTSWSAARCPVMSCSTASPQGLILGRFHVASLGIPALPFHPALWCLLLTFPMHFLPCWVLRVTKAESERGRLQQEDVREKEMGSKVTIRKFLRACEDQNLWTAHPDVRWDRELHLARTLFPFLSQ